MTKQVSGLSAVVYVVLLLGIPAFAQTSERRPATPTPPAEAVTTLPPGANSMEVVANELGLLRKSLQTLNARLREISEKVLATDSGRGGSSNDNQGSITRSLDLLSRTEQRAEVLRKQLLELIEKETAVKSRLVQIEEETRPENIERTMSLTGTTRAAEQRDVRRRVLENERRGFESLLNQTVLSRQRLEEDVRQADALVARIRQRLLPLIEKEIDKLNPNPD